VAVKPLVADFERSTDQGLGRKLLHCEADRIGGALKPPVGDGLAPESARKARIQFCSHAVVEELSPNLGDGLIGQAAATLG
jgi:hypothetical protein